MPDSTNKNPFSDPNYGSDLAKTSAEKNPFSDPDYGKEQGRGVSGHVKDLGLSAAAGVNSAVDAAIGIGSLYTGGKLGKDIQESGIYTPGSGSKYWNEKKSDQSKAVDREFSEAEGIVDKAKVALSNPSKIANAVVESVPSMVVGGLLGRGAGALTGGSMSGVAAGSVGEGLVMAGSQAEQIRQENHNGLLSDDQRGLSALTGGAGTLFGYMGGRIAQKLGIADVDTMLATGSRHAATREAVEQAAKEIKLRDIPKGVVAGAISEGLLEELPQSVTEQILQNQALGKEWNEGLDDAIVMGTLAGMAMGGTASGYARTADYLSQPNDSGNSATAENTDPLLPVPTGGNGGGTGLGFDGLQGEYIPADAQTAQQRQSHQNFEYDQFSTDAENRLNPPEVVQLGYGDSSNPEFPDSSNTPENPNGPTSPNNLYLDMPKPSEQMGINPDDGPLSSAAALAVDGGAFSKMTEMAQASQDGTFINEGTNATASNSVNPAVPSSYQQLLNNENDGYGFGSKNQNVVGEQKVSSVNDGSHQITTSSQGLTNSEQIPEQQLNQVDTEISTIEAQMATEKSVPKKMQMRKQLEALNAERTALAEQNNLTSVQELSLGGDTRNETGTTTSSFQTQPLDHGALNVPLSKRGNIDAQLDQYKKEQAALENEQREIKKSNHADAQATAKPMFDTLSAAQIKIYANKAGIRPSEAKKELKSMAHWQPKKAVKVFEALKAVQSEQDKSKAPPLEPSIALVQEIQKLEQQLADAKSVPQKVRLRKQIAELQKDSPIDQAAHEAATSIQNDLPEPTQAQIEAGNYKKGHIKVHGLDIAVENPRGSERRGTDPDGKEWSHQMSDHYGYIKKTTGADNEHIDTYIGRNPESDQVFIVDQMDQQTGGFDEHKVMLGFDSQEEAVKAYSSNFDKGWKVGPVRAMNKDEFKSWLKDGDTQKPAGESAQQSESNKEQPTTALNEQDVRAAYGDSLESVMSDVETLADDFTIDLHSVVKKSNALKNPNYHAVKHKDGRVEILGMKHPTTGEWVGKAPTQDKAPVQESPTPVQAPVQEQNTIGTLMNKSTKTNPSKKPNSSSRAQSLNIQIQSDSGLTHSIPSKLMDQVHKLGDVVNDLASMKTDGVKTNVLYGKQLLAKIAKLNPDVQVHIVSDLDSIKDKTTQARLSSGGFYIPDQNILYVYPQTDLWEGAALELLNHELIHTVTEQSITANQVSRENLDKLEEFRSILGEYIWNQGENLDENMAERLRYAYEQDFPHELLAVSTAETNVREVFKAMLGEGGFKQLDSIFTEISTNQFKEKRNDRLPTRGQSQQPSRDRAENLSTSDTGTAKSDGAAAHSSDGVTGSVTDKSSGTQDGSKRSTQTDVRDGTDFDDRFKSVLEDSGRDSGKTLGRISEEDKQLKNNNDKKRFSRAENSAASSTVAQVREALVSRFGEKTIADLEAQGILNIVQDQQESMTGNVEGWYEDGKVTLVASNLDADSAVATFLHELGGHGGFQNLMNKEAYADLMRQFERMVEQGNPVALEAKRLAERELKREVQLDEYLPYMITLASQMQTRNVAQKVAIKRFMDRVVSAVKAWLYDQGMQLNLNENDVLALAERMVAAQSGISAVQRVKQQLQNTSTWMKAPNGNPTRLTEQQWLQVRTPAFKRWFGDWENNPTQASQAMDENGEPKIYYHGTAAEFNKFNRGGGLLGRGVYLTDDLATAQMYGDVKSNNNGIVMPLFVNTKQTMQATDRTTRAQIDRASASGRFDGIRRSFQDMDFLVAFNPNQVKHAMKNGGSFDAQDEDIRFSRQFNPQQTFDNIMNGIKGLNVQSTKDWTGNKWIDWLGIALSFLGRRQLTEIYSKLLPPLSKYNELAAQMDADKNDAGAEADSIVREWSNLKDEDALANLMHDATLAKIDPAKPHVAGDSITKYKQLRDDFNALSPEAQDMYVRARDAYKKHYAKVHQAIKERILRSELSNTKKAELLKDMDNQFFGYVKGVYFPLARFGKYVVVVRNQNNQVESVSRAETMAEAQKARTEMMKKFPLWKVDRVILDKEFNASRDGVGRGFMSSLFSEVDNLGLSTAEQAEFEDTLSQLYLSSMPDLSWAKHGIHRKGTAGFSQDARRAFAQNMFHGAGYLAKLRYADQMAEQLDAMQKYAMEEVKTNPEFDQPKAQRVIDEMNKRHENLMNPKSHPLSSMLTSVGFIYYLGLSPAAAMVNLSQTPLVAYPIMGAKWGFDNAAKELLKASNDFRKGVELHKVKWEGTKTDLYKTVSADISKFLNTDEQQAYKDAVDRGVIDVTQAHDLAGIAQGEDSGVMWKMRPIMRAASTMFHSAERFNREVTFIAAYRLARKAGSTHDTAFDQAVDATYKGHFDYSSGNRPRIMQGNVAKVLLLFKQFGQNMIYTLSRQTYQSIKGETEAERKEARRALGAVLGMHAAFAGVLGLPLVGFLLGAASWMGGDDDDPWDAEVALRNYLAETFNPTISNLITKGVPRAVTPVDMSGRVGINNLLLPDVQEGLEGKRWAESAMSAALGPVAGIGTNVVKGAQEISEGHNLRGVETMLPVFLKNFAKTYRYNDEGVQDKTGVSIMDDVDTMDLLVQGMGFSPSDIRTANEGKSAIYQMNRKLNERRSSLMTLWSRAKMMDDQEDMDEIWKEIQGFNEKNPSRRITRLNLNQSYRNRKRRIDKSEDGIYLSRNQQGVREAGNFAFAE